MCIRGRGKQAEKKREKGEDRPHFPLRGPHSPSHVVSTPSTKSLMEEGTTPFLPFCLVLLLCLGFVLWMPASSSRVIL